MQASLQNMQNLQAAGCSCRHTLADAHHHARGHNALQLAYASNVWVRGVRVLNADNALFFSWVHRSSCLGE